MTKQAVCDNFYVIIGTEIKKKKIQLLNELAIFDFFHVIYNNEFCDNVYILITLKIEEEKYSCYY